MCFGQDYAVPRYCAVGVDEIRVRRERARQARGVVSPGKTQSVHQQVCDAGADASRKRRSFSVGQRVEMLRQCEGRSVLD